MVDWVWSVARGTAAGVLRHLEAVCIGVGWKIAMVFGLASAPDGLSAHPFGHDDFVCHLLCHHPHPETGVLHGPLPATSMLPQPLAHSRQ